MRSVALLSILAFLFTFTTFGCAHHSHKCDSKCAKGCAEAKCCGKDGACCKADGKACATECKATCGCDGCSKICASGKGGWCEKCKHGCAQGKMTECKACADKNAPCAACAAKTKS